MNTELPPFPNLRNAILKLEKCLNCTYCYRVFADPYTLTTCGHTFCKYCITSFISAQKANCPLCDLPNWLNQSQPNRQLKALLQNYEKLRCLLAIPDPKTPVPNRIQPRVEKKRKRKKLDLFESTTKIMEEEEPNIMHDTPSLVINPNNKIIPDNSEVINLHCRESLVQNIHSNELETRSLPNGLEACITQIDNDKLPYNDNAITRTSHSGENMTVVTADTLHKSQSISIDHTSSLVLSQEINLNGLNLTQANSQEISLNLDIISRSDDLQKDGRLASQQNTPFIAQFGKPIPFQISQTNSPFIKYLSQKGENSPFLQQLYSSPNSSIHIGKQLKSQQQQTFPSPITKQQDVTPSFHTPNNTHVLHNVITPNSTAKQHCSVLYSSPNDFERNIFPDPSNLISTPERLNSTPTADRTSEELLTSPVHKSILLVTTERLPESITDNFINSQSQSPDLLSGFRFQIPEAIKPSVVELAESITEQPNEYHSIPNSPITATPHSDSQNNDMLSSPVKVSVDIYNSSVHTPTRSNIQDTIITFPVTDKTGLHTVTEAHSPVRTSFIRSHEQLSPVIEPCKDSSNNTSPIPTPPISHISPVIDITPHTKQSLTSMVTPEYQQPVNNNAEISILIKEDSMPENPPVQTDHIKHPLPADIQTIVIPDDSPKKIPEVKKDTHRPRQLYPKRIHSNLSSKMNTHNITLPTIDTPCMGNFFNHFPQSQPGSKPQFMYPSTRNYLARSTKFQQFDTVATSQFRYFPQISPLDSLTSKSKAFANQTPKDYDTFFNFILNQTLEQQRQKLDISKCSNDSQISLQENISSLNGSSQPFPSPQNTNKHDTFSSISQTDNTPNVHDNNLKGTLLSTDNRIDSIVVDNNSLFPGENDEVEILLTPVSIPKFDSPTVNEQENSVVVEDLLENSVVDDLEENSVVVEDLLANSVVEDLLTNSVVEDLLTNSVVVEDLLENCVVVEDLLENSVVVEDLLTNCVVEDLLANSVGNGDECEHIEMSHSQPADPVSNMSQTDTPMVTAPEEISLSHSESKIPENGDVSMLNDGAITPANHLTNSQSNNYIPSLISSPPYTNVNTIDVHSIATMLVSPNNSELSPHINTSVIIQELPLPSNTGKFDIFDIKDSPTNLSLPSPKHTKITSPTILSRFVTLQSYTPNHKYENTQPYSTPPACSQFSQMNEVLSLARDLENRISKNETIDSDTDSIFSLTQNSPKTNSNNFISYLSLSPKIRTFPTPPSVAREMVQGMERFNSPLGVSIFDYADMGIDENIYVIPHFSPSIGSPPTLNPVKRRANTHQSKKLKLEKYKHIEQQASRILSPKKANEISNFSNRPFRNRGKSRYKHRPFQAN